MSRATTGVSPREKPVTPDAQSHAHVRGSVALVAGKGLDLVTKFALQILLVHQLAQGDYGTFVYGNTLAGLFAVIIKVGQGRAIGRLVPLHQERKDPSAIAAAVRAAAVIVAGCTTIFLFAMAMVFGVAGLEPTASANSGLIVLLLLLQAPLTAVGSVTANLLAAYGDVRSLFLREHIVEPAVKLAAVLVAVASSLSVVAIAAAWLAASAAGVIYAALATLRHLHGTGRSGRAPIRSQLGWGLPVMGSDLIHIATEPLVILTLEATHGSAAVAELKVVLPLVFLSLVGAEAFNRLYYPTASRLIAKSDAAALNQLYWRTAAWASSAALPIVLVSVTAAEPLVTTLFGTSYRSSAPLLKLLAIAHYLHAASGLNTSTLKAAGRFRWIYAVDIAGLTSTAIVAVVLVPHYGVGGAAVAMASAVVAQNLLANAALLPAAGISPFPMAAVRFQTTALAGIGLGWLAGSTLSLDLVSGLAVATALALIVIAINRRSLDITGAFPELKRRKQQS